MLDKAIEDQRDAYRKLHELSNKMNETKDRLIKAKDDEIQALTKKLEEANKKSRKMACNHELSPGESQYGPICKDCKEDFYKG